MYICGVKEAGFCGHKEVLPVEPIEIGGLTVFALLKGLSNIAGVGGGQVSVPIIMEMFMFTTKPAVALSSFSIFLTTLATFFLNFREKHPEKNNVVVIDYDLVAIMMPTTLAGAQIGAIMLVTFPSVIILALLTIMNALLAIQSVFKALEITRKENKEREQQSKIKKEKATAPAVTQINEEDVQMDSPPVPTE